MPKAKLRCINRARYSTFDFMEKIYSCPKCGDLLDVVYDFENVNSDGGKKPSTPGGVRPTNWTLAECGGSEKCWTLSMTLPTSFPCPKETPQVRSAPAGLKPLTFPKKGELGATRQGSMLGLKAEVSNQPCLAIISFFEKEFIPSLFRRLPMLFSFPLLSRHLFFCPNESTLPTQSIPTRARE